MKEFMLLATGIFLGGLLVKKITDIKTLKTENEVLKSKLSGATA